MKTVIGILISLACLALAVMMITEADNTWLPHTKEVRDCLRAGHTAITTEHGVTCE